MQFLVRSNNVCLISCMNEEHYCDHNVEGHAVEGPVDCVRMR